MIDVAGSLTDKQAHDLKRVLHSVQRLTRMIADLLDLSRIEMRQTELHQAVGSYSRASRRGGGEL